MLPDPRLLPHPSEAPTGHPKSICPACGVTNDRAIHALKWNRKYGYWWPDSLDWKLRHSSDAATWAAECGEFGCHDPRGAT